VIRDWWTTGPHGVRVFGNDVAHGDFVAESTKEEAEEALDVVGEVLNEVFQSPARIACRHAARQGGTGKPGAGGTEPARAMLGGSPAQSA